MEIKCTCMILKNIIMGPYQVCHVNMFLFIYFGVFVEYDKHCGCLKFYDKLNQPSHIFFHCDTFFQNLMTT
jgi:hypothetical protein